MTSKKRKKIERDLETLSANIPLTNSTIQEEWYIRFQRKYMQTYGRDYQPKVMAVRV